MANNKKASNFILETIAQQMSKIGKYEPIILIMLSAVFGISVLLQFFGLLENSALYGGLIVIVAAWCIWFVKFMQYGIYGERIPVLRLYRNNLSRLTIENVNSEKGLKWSKDGTKPPTQISRINKHTDIETGRPFLIAAEGISDNISIWDSLGGHTGEMARDLNTKFEIIWNTAYQACQNDMLKMGKKLFTDPQFIAVVLLGVGMVVLFVFIVGINSQLSEMAKILKDILAVASAP